MGVRSSKRLSFQPILTAALGILCACETDAVHRTGAVVRDSAGTRIVESESSVWPDGRGWRVPAVPQVEIGTVEGEEAYQLFRVRDAIRLSDGRIVVVNAGASDVRIYAPDGRHQRTVGRAGEGPGEFRYPWQAYRLPGDSIVVADFDRLSLFDSGGKFVRSDPSPPSTPRGRFGDGSFLWVGFAAGVNPYRLGHVRNSMALIRTWPDGSAPDTLARVLGTESYRITVGNGIANYRAPFGVERAVEVCGGRIYTGDGSTFEVAVFDSLGALAALYRRPEIPRRITAEDIQRYEARLLSGAQTDNQRRTRRRLLDEWSYPEQRPAYDRLLCDAEENVWVRHYALADDRPATWSVFDRDGRWLGEVRSPAGLRVTEIGADYVLGTATDELGVEYVRLYRLEKTSDESSTGPTRNGA